MATKPEPRDVALEAVAKAMSRLEIVLGSKSTESQPEQIPRSMLMEIDPWDPDEIEAVPIGTYFEIFDGITRDLADSLRVQLLRIKLRGTAKTFLLDNGHLLEGENPYQGLKRALLRWYGREDPEKAAEKLWTMQKSPGESFRQFAERVRHTAAQASRVDGLVMDATQARAWIAARSVKAFLRGLPGSYAGFFVNNPPASLEEAMKKAEELEDALEPRSSDHWNVARIQVQDKRCFRCRELGHIASGCPNIPRPPTPPPQRRAAMGSPQKPCSYCGSRVHFPAHCLKNPKNFPCDYCGLYGHKESECRVKSSHYADEPMCDYCGYYGHLEADCLQKTESYVPPEPVTRPEPRKVLALTSAAHEPNPQQAIAIRMETKSAETPSVTTPTTEEPDVCLPAVDSPFKQTMRVKVSLSGHDRVLIVDTGAQISVLTHPVPGVPIVPTKILAWGADGQPMPFLGQQQLEVVIGPLKLTHAFRIFARDHSGLDLLGLDLLRRIPASIHLDSCEVRMTHPKTGQSVVISEVITGYLSPARPVPRPDVAQPMRPRIAIVGGSNAFDTAHLLRPEDIEEPMSDDCPILDPSEEFPIEDLDNPVPDLLTVLEQQLQHLPTEDLNYVSSILAKRCSTMPKDLRAMVTEVERSFEEPSRDESSMDESPVARMLPRPSVSQPRVSEVNQGEVDIEKEWTILESGVDMMYRATNTEDRVNGWYRYASAVKVLKEWTRQKQAMVSPVVDVNTLAIKIARRIRQPPVKLPTPGEFADAVVERMREQLPENPVPQNLAAEIAELVSQRQAPAYSPIHDATALAAAVIEKLRGEVNLTLRQPDPPAVEPLVPMDQPEEDVEPESDLEQEEPEDAPEEASHTEDSDHPVQRRVCVACGKPRAHNSQLWCEACRAFLRRSKKAAAEGNPSRCNDSRHRHQPDVANCRGCRLQHLQSLDTKASQSEDGDCASEDIGFPRGGECDRRISPLRITMRPSSNTCKRARPRSAGSPPAALPSTSAELPMPPPAAPPTAPPPPAHARDHRLAPPKSRTPSAARPSDQLRQVP
ncbi:hypothetical protein GE061_008401 [Apolygus lucorum]|uniref:CCHC-type domain-containing protein n=1 Tax=Apolygus lucorum TaxID=248454 RepID=A0A8S9WR39_APOLU|nr:hypothetical protein GE061_008401 [Apolygus lucorum]